MKKIIFITGASKGLGKIVTQGLIKQGHTVYAGVRNLATAPVDAIPLVLDLRDENTMSEAIQHIIREEGVLDVLIHNAGIAYYGPVDSLTVSEAQDLFQVNFFGPFRLSQLALPYMREKKSGRMLFVSSIRGIESLGLMGLYSASKASIEAIAFDWAVTLAKWGIIVSVLQPGPMDTGIHINHGTFFTEQENPYLPYPKVDVIWESSQHTCDKILEWIDIASPDFRIQSTSFAKNTVDKHLKDSSGKQWYGEQYRLFYPIEK